MLIRIYPSSSVFIFLVATSRHALSRACQVRRVVEQSGTCGAQKRPTSASLLSSSGFSYENKVMVRIENILSSRELAGLYRDMDNSELDEIIQLTGCPKPCFYKKYNFLGEKYISSFVTDHFLLSLWAVSNITRVETEQLIYPWTSLVAEFGGALGLFLGISFMSLWEGIYLLKPCFKY